MSSHFDEKFDCYDKKNFPLKSGKCFHHHQKKRQFGQFFMIIIIIIIYHNNNYPECLDCFFLEGRKKFRKKVIFLNLVGCNIV